jgi:hypothetical protein
MLQLSKLLLDAGLLLRLLIRSKQLLQGLEKEEVGKIKAENKQQSTTYITNQCA